MATIHTPLDPFEVKVLDRNAQALGVPVRVLMENAGQALADGIRSRGPEGPVIFLCGKGNNGGDGLVAAGELATERGVTVLMAGDPGTDLARDAFDALPSGVRVLFPQEEDIGPIVDSAAVIVDALLGAGAKGAPRGVVAALIDAQRGADAFRVSVDVPTGAGHEGAFVPDVTVAMGASKVVPGGASKGEEVVADIGIPERAFSHTGPGELALYPVPSSDQHKGQGGFVLVIGGGPYAGAPALSAMAAMRAGADMAVALVPEPAWGSVAGFSPNLVARPLEGENLDFADPKNRVALNKWLGMVDSVVIGPGLGKMAPVGQSVPLALERVLELALPFTADADALWALGESDVDLSSGKGVLTPHAGEFKVLTGQAAPGSDDVEGRVKVVQGAASELGSTILLKGPVDIVADASRAKRNATGTPAMSHGGTGDVLAGVVGALQAKGLDPFDAARVASFVVGKAGEFAAREASFGLLATDVVEEIPRVLRAYVDGSN